MVLTKDGGAVGACSYSDDSTSGENSAVYAGHFYNDNDDGCEESELDCSMTESEGHRYDAMNEELSAVQQQVSNILALSMFFEKKLASAIDERNHLRSLRVKLLYRNLAAAVLGRLIARSDREFSEYNTACKAYVRRLLQLQDRETVTRAAQKILNYLQSKLKDATAATNFDIRHVSRVTRVMGVTIPKPRCK